MILRTSSVRNSMDIDAMYPTILRPDTFHGMFFSELDLSRFWRIRKYKSSSQFGTLCSRVGYRNENDDYTKTKNNY